MNKFVRRVALAILLSTPGGVALAADALPASAAFDDLPEPPTDPRDIEGVWLPGAFVGGGGPSGGAYGGGTLMCAPVQRLNGAGGGMSNLWIVGDKIIVMISEEGMDIRKIYLDGAHPKEVTPQPNGHSIGHWEGNTLVVDTIGFSGAGGKLSDEHVVERITKLKIGNSWQLQTDFTATTSGQTRTSSSMQVWRPDLRVIENVCEAGFERTPTDDPRRNKE
jgi:hypothetical protein